MRSLNGVIVHRHRPLEFVEEADAVLIGSGVRMREIAADPAMLTREALHSVAPVGEKDRFVDHPTSISEAEFAPT